MEERWRNKRREKGVEERKVGRVGERSRKGGREGKKEGQVKFVRKKKKITNN